MTLERALRHLSVLGVNAIILVLILLALELGFRALPSPNEPASDGAVEFVGAQPFLYYRWAPAACTAVESCRSGLGFS